MLTIKNACKKFASQIVLQDVSFTVNKSSIIGIAGPSGCGKSTLLRCIQKLESLDSGVIECNGTSGFMLQDFQLFPHMTVLQNLVYAPKLHNKKVAYDSLALEKLQQLGLENKANNYPAQLSGGQKQRVALARSLMMQPDILLCDEPTSGLDVATTEDVLGLLQSVRAMGVTMIIASHDLDFLTKIADRIILMKAGHIVCDMHPNNQHETISKLKAYY